MTSENINNLLKGIRETCGDSDVIFIPEINPDGIGMVYSFNYQYREYNPLDNYQLMVGKNEFSKCFKSENYGFLDVNSTDYLSIVDGDWVETPQEVYRYLTEQQKDDMDADIMIAIYELSKQYNFETIHLVVYDEDGDVAISQFTLSKLKSLIR